MKAHPYADRFPMLSTEELERLADDIRENGLNNPVVLDDEGRILDGRNRWAACELAGVTPETTLFEGDDPAAFVLSSNVSRRHLTTGQQAMSTALVLVDAGKRENGRWAYGSLAESADPRNSAKAWSRDMQRSGIVLDYAPDLAEQVVEGTLALDAAYREAESRREAERSLLEEQERIAAEEEAYREHLEQIAPQYLSEHKTARQAFTAWEDDNRKEAARLRQEKATTEREAAERREAASSLYTGIAKALSVISGYGEYEHIDNLMSDFDVSLLKPRSYATEFTPESFEKAHRFISMLEEWEAAR